jgi:hypothetical protein
MGGYGSGRWCRHTKKDIVEDCRVLDMNRWTREGILREGVHHFGRWKWCNAATGEETSSIEYEVDTTDGMWTISEPRVTLSILVSDATCTPMLNSCAA